MMRKIITLLLHCQAASAVQYTLMLHHMLSKGFESSPEYSFAGIAEEVQIFYYDTIGKTPTVTHDFMRELIKTAGPEWDELIENCKKYQYTLTADTANFTKISPQTEDYDIQQIVGCEVDNETTDIKGFLQYSYNGEDFIEFDMNSETWLALDAQALTLKKQWDANPARNGFWKNFLQISCPEVINTALFFGKTYLTRRDLPLVSLLQKTPSSLVSCHATGFYPERALMFWRKDGEEIHEDVEHGDILINHDESFQLNVDLDVSAINPDDWSRYDCVFQLAGVQKNITTKLDKALIRTNFARTKETLSVVSIAVIATVSVVIVIILSVFGVTAVKKRNLSAAERLSAERSSTPSSDNISL